MIFFNWDNKFMTAMSKASDAILLGILWYCMLVSRSLQLEHRPLRFTMHITRQFGREGDMPGKSFSAPLNQTLNLLSSFGLLFWAVSCDRNGLLYFVYVIGNHGSRIVFAADDHDRDCLNNDMGNLRVSVSGAFRKYYESDHKKQYSGYGHE